MQEYNIPQKLYCDAMTVMVQGAYNYTRKNGLTIRPVYTPNN